MARPVNADAGATRARVLHSALNLFSERGAAGTSIREVARGAGVSLAMVHHYFGSKEALLEACIDSMYSELTEMGPPVIAAFAAGGDLPALLERVALAAFRFARQHRTAVRLLLRSAVEAGEVTPRGREVLLTFLDRATGTLAAVSGRPTGDLRFPIQTAVFLIARYAVQEDDELVAVAGLGGRGRKAVRAAEEALEAHLTDTLIALLGPATRAR